MITIIRDQALCQAFSGISKGVRMKKEKTLQRAVSPVIRNKRAKIAAYLKRNYLLYLMMVPGIAVILIFKYYPMSGIQLAFKDWDPWKGIWGSEWAVDEAGKTDLLFHFRSLMGDELFWTKFLNTLRISILKIVFGFPVPIIIALFLNEMTWKIYKNIVQTISYLPHFISWVIISGILLTMTQADSSFQLFLEKVFGKQVYFFSNNNSFIVMIVLSNIWKNCGWGTIIYLAALQSIDVELYEAAEVDGAERWAKMWYITLPGILPAVCIRLIFTVSGITSAGFDQIFNMYNSTVYEKGDVLETYLYRNGIIGGKYDISQAMGLFNSLIGLTLTLTANKIVNKLGGEGIW